MNASTSLAYFKNQRVVVLGLGRSGQGPAQALMAEGAQVLAWDDNEGVRKQAQAQGISVIDTPEAIDWKSVDHFLISPGIPHTYPAPHPLAALARAHHISPIGDIECFFKSHPLATLIGVTGTNGKSTTAALIAHLLKEAGKEMALGGNIGIPVFALPRLPQEGFYVLELSSYQLELTPSLALSASILLNISPDHLDRHGGIDGYVQAKKKIFQNGCRNALAVIGVDDPFCAEIFQEFQASQRPAIPISMEERQAQGVSVIEGILEDTFSSNAPISFSFQNNRSLKGKHNGQNAAAAYSALRLLGVPSQVLHKGLETFSGLPHRQEWIGCFAGVDYINDSKATNAEAVACAFACYGPHHSLYWIGGGRPKEADLTPLNPFWKQIRKAFLIGEAAQSFGDILQAHGVPYTISYTLEKACQEAMQAAQQDNQPKPLVLLSPACTSFDQFESFEHRGDAFRNWVLRQITYAQ